MIKKFTILGFILMSGGFGMALAIIISMIVGNSFYGLDTLVEKGTVVLGAFIVGGIGLGIFVKVMKDEEKQKEEQS